MVTRPKSVPSGNNGGDPRFYDYEVLFYNLPGLAHLIARNDSDVWENDKGGPEPSLGATPSPTT